MTFFFLIILPLIDPGTPRFEIAVATGKSNQMPNEWLQIEEIAEYEIGQSYWVRVQVENNVSGNYVMKGGNWYMQNLSFFDSQRRFIGKANNVNLSLGENANTFYIFYPFRDEKEKEVFAISVTPELDFLEKKERKNIVQVAFQSILFFLFFISGFLAFSSRDRVYLYYGLYILSICFFFGYQYGLLGHVLPWIKDVPMMWVWFLSFTITLFYALFTVSFLNMKQVDPQAYKIMTVGIYYTLFLTVLSSILYALQIDVQHTYGYKIPTLGVEVLLIGMVFYRITRFPGRTKKYYLVGVSLLLIVSLGAQLASAFQTIENFNNLIQAGLITEVFILSLGLGVRVNEIQKKKNEAQNDLISQMQVNDALQKSYADRLEQQVSERTGRLQKKYQENELLLKEIHHRVKNNLQMITSMINMQERRTESDSTKSQLVSTRNKIKSISLIHEHLYSTELFSHVNLEQYVSDLISMLVSSLHKGKSIVIAKEIVDTKVSLDMAMLIGLVLNELITNSLKYAFEKSAKPQLKIYLKKTGDICEIEVIDNGPGIKQEHNSNGLGYTIIKAISESVDGKIVKENTPFGYSVKVQMTFNLLDEEPIEV